VQTTVEIVRLAESQFETAAGVMTRAFLDDPFFTYWVPDPDALREKLSVFGQWANRYCHLFGETYTTAGTVRGAAYWIPPDAGEMTPGRLERTGYSHVTEVFGEEAMARFDAVMGKLDELHHLNMPTAHWYLMGIGVDPPHQGQGVGGQLMQPAFRKADMAGLPCYLETQKARNVPFYQRHGFEVVGEVDPTDAGPHFWLMRRNPRKTHG
jgi:GNAT superfamily N-acetyltransferase